ncbi:MAG: S8 family serine peptidase, partial [bacterium]|nr:S8 family serine peptidase [bacterium]
MKRFGSYNSAHRFARTMKTLLGSLTIICLLAAISSAPVTSNDTALPEGEAPFVQGELIVQVDGPDAAERIAARFPGYSLTPVKLLSRRMNIWLYEYSLSNMKMTDQVGLLEAVRRDGDVLLAQFNHYVAQRQTIPNDPSFSLQWSKHNVGQSGGTVDADIDAPEAWDITPGDTTLNGDQIVVAIVDGGCDLSHNDIDFFKNTLEIPSNGLDDDGNGYVDDYDGWNAYNSTGNVGSDSHGTHVAGIAAAIGNNGVGVAGVNWGAKVMPIAGSSSNEAVVVEAYGYALEMRATYNETNGAAGAFVVSANSSFGVDYGNPASYPIWCATYDSMGAAGIINATATANIGMDIDVNGDVPTACPSDYMIAVTNTTRYDSRNSGAAWGLATIDLGAPGTSVYSTLPGSTYGTLTGTSMATPQVTGAVAFLYSAACATLLNDMWADPGAVALFMKQAIMDGTDPNASLNGFTVSGGRLNLNGALQLVLAYPCGLNISHTALEDTKDDINPVEVVASITSAVAIDTDSALVYYSTDGGTIFTPVLMSDYGGGDFHGFIPAQSPGTMVDYYIFARDVDGNRDSTETYSFRVIDYNVLVSPSSGAGFGPAGDTVNFVLTVTNDGILSDDFAFSYSGNFWAVSTWDATGSYEITSTGSLLPDDTANVLVRVVVPASLYGDQDSVEFIATSLGDGNYFATSSL